MELQGSDAMDFKFFSYIKEVTDSSQLCFVCKTQESTRDNYHKNSVHDDIWSRYQLKCGCQAHTRCFRKYMSKKKEIHCLNCDKTIEQIIQNTYCFKCGEYGHVYETHFINIELTKKEYPDCYNCSNIGSIMSREERSIHFCTKCNKGREGLRLSKLQYKNGIGMGFSEKNL